MKIIFVDLNKDVTKALFKYFLLYNNVEVYTDNILNYSADAIVSPANSFGFMDGGIDYAYTKYFGGGLQERLQWKINQNSIDGELLVGQSLCVETLNSNIPWLISAPTMRVPADVSNTVNVYLAFRAVLHLAVRENFTSVLCPGLGTCTGNVSPEIAAHQMRAAYEEVINGRKPNCMCLMDYLKYDFCLRQL